ncbi:hypothetical protein [Brevundimonas sp. FT23042]|uniref:hypothetical protein n=1 Tax=Brevundimonas sp. FT23042 TaxID=3393749 RepID=UPI003B5893AC
MSAYSLRLHYSSGIDPTDEPLDALNEAEARELAQVRLLLTRDYSHVELHHAGQPVHVFARD